MGKAIFIPNTAPSYMAVSTDISGSKVDNATYIGAKIYMTDTGKTYIIKDDLTLEEMAGESITISGEVPVSGSVSAIITSMPVGGYATEDNFISGSTSSITDTTSREVIEAQAGTIYINQILITNGNDDNGTFVNLTDGDGGVVKYTGFAAKGGGGFCIEFPTPLKFTSGSGIYAVCETTGANVRASISGYLGG
jgi:hypothetical protein